MHRCPLWAPLLGITPERVVCIDLLHTLHLGVMLGFVRHCLWVLLRSHVWGYLEATQEEGFRVAVAGLRAELFGWYHDFNEEDVTRVADLVPSMLGSLSDPILKAKGAETYGLLLFAISALQRHAGKVGVQGATLVAAGKYLHRYVVVCRVAPVQPSPRQQQD